MSPTDVSVHRPITVDGSVVSSADFLRLVSDELVNFLDRIF